MDGSPSFSWVDRGLAKLGLTIDLAPGEVPERFGPGAPTVDLLARGAISLADTEGWLSVKRTAADSSGRFRSSVGTLKGHPGLVARTTFVGSARLDRARFATFAVDDAMIDVARVWDETFVEARFTHVILRSGEAFASGDRALAGAPLADVAKVMRWVFAVPGMARRELVSVYVPHVAPGAITCAYLPVRGDLFPTARGARLVRARLLAPCFDHAVFDGDRCTTLVHTMGASIGGWVPQWLTTTAFWAKTFQDAMKKEAAHLAALLSHEGREGAAFARIERRDGTSI
jgi:hypothetical protein